jgi:hypothetical protein
MLALPLPRFSAWMLVELEPLEVMLGPLQVTLASLEGERPYDIAQIALLLKVPFTSICVFVALMTAAPLDCIRSPDWLLPPGFFVFSMIIGAVPFVVIMWMSAAGPTGGGEVFAALTALPPGLVTVTGA